MEATMSGIPLKSGTFIKDFRGNEWQFNSVTRAKNHCGTAKVSVSHNGKNREFYHHVFPGLDVK